MAGYPSPLAGYENGPPLPTTLNADGKSLVNLPLADGTRSQAYDVFVDPLDKENNRFDFHGDLNASSPLHMSVFLITAFIVQCTTCRMFRSRRSLQRSCMSGSEESFPKYVFQYFLRSQRMFTTSTGFHLQFRIYKFWDKPVGPHPVAMFEVNSRSSLIPDLLFIVFSQVNVFNPHQTGTLFSWLAVNRGPCS